MSVFPRRGSRYCRRNSAGRHRAALIKRHQLLARQTPANGQLLALFVLSFSSGTFEEATARRPVVGMRNRVRGGPARRRASGSSVLLGSRVFRVHKLNWFYCARRISITARRIVLEPRHDLRRRIVVQRWVNKILTPMFRSPTSRFGSWQR